MFPIPQNIGNSATTSPNMVLNFTSGVLDSRVTFTRTQGTTTAATYYNSSGVLSYATANTPRFDYDPVALTPKGLLIEETRTNVLTYSSALDNAAWSKNSCTVASGITAPDGTSTACTITASAGSAAHKAYVATAIPSATGTTTYSVFVKPGTSNYVSLAVLYGTTQYSTVTYNLSSVAVTQTVSSGGVSAVTSSITAAANGFYRLTCTATSTQAVAVSVQVSSSATPTIGSYGDETWTAAGTETIYVWGTQLEVGAFPTSYIPTVASSVQRGADNASMTGTNFSSWYSQTGGVLYTRFFLKQIAAGARVFCLSGGSDATRIGDVQIQSGGLLIYNGAALISPTGVPSVGTLQKLSYRYGPSNYGASVNGNTTATSSTATVNAGTTLLIGVDNSLTSYINGWVNSMSYYPNMLTNSQLQGLSK